MVAAVPQNSTIPTIGSSRMVRRMATGVVNSLIRDLSSGDANGQFDPCGCPRCCFIGCVKITLVIEDAGSPDADTTECFDSADFPSQADSEAAVLRSIRRSDEGAEASSSVFRKAGAPTPGT